MAALTVYIGDSMSDLAPLLSADIGIVIGQNKLLRRVARAAGVQLKPLVSGTVPHQNHLSLAMFAVLLPCQDHTLPLPIALLLT